ncbi:MAG: S8 family serine peptidase [Candidatus Hodarchaeales archaeon]
MFHQRISLLLLLLVIIPFFFSTQANNSLHDQALAPILLEKEVKSSLVNWGNKEPSESTQAILLFKTNAPHHFPNVQVLHMFALRPALLLEGPMEDIRKIAHKERPNLVVVAENQRLNTSQLPVALQMENYRFSSSQTGDIRDIIGATRLHSLGYDGTGIRIGIIDSGINSDHPDFEGRVIAEKSFVLKELGYSTDVLNTYDEYGHGTWVAGVAAGKEFGIAPKAEIINAKIFGNRSVAGNGGISGEETTAAIIAAIEYCILHEADIINLSIGQYHNLPWDLRQQWINDVSLNFGTIFAVAAGNSGDNGIDGGTVNNPGTALQAITVAAAAGFHAFAGFSATGPKPDYSMKPDITAPGVSIWGPSSHDSYTTKSGTSASTPLVAGAAALLLQYAKTEELDACSGTIKAALMTGAEVMEVDDTVFPAWRQGAGFLNVSHALDALEKAKTSNSFNLFYLHPRKFPFKPFSTLFKGQKWAFNLTVIVSGSMNLTFAAPNSTLQIDIAPTAEVRGSQLVPIMFYAPVTANDGPVLETINVTSASSVKSDFHIGGTVKKANYSILLDEAHQIIARRPEKASRQVQYGDNNNIYGAFRDWTVLMESRQIAVTPFVGSELNSSILENYDLFVMLNPFSYNYDVLTDWIASENRSYVPFTASEIEALRKWVDNQGSLLMITRGNSTVYVPALNDFLSPYGIVVNFDDIGPFWDYEIREPISVTGVYSGPTLRSDPQNYILADSAPGYLVVGHQRDSGSRVLVIGTDYCFDNYAFHGEYGLSGDQNRQFSLDVMSWVLQEEMLPITLSSNSESTMSSKDTSPSAGFSILLLLTAGIFSSWFRRNKNPK